MRFELNGTGREIDVPDHTRLIDLLRDHLGLTGTKEGCSVGVCGACSVLVDGQLMSACLMPAAFVDGTTVTTIEGLAPDDEHLSPLQDAFIRHGGFQCGICTPGQIVAATALLAGTAAADDRPDQELDDGQPVSLHRLLQDRRKHPSRSESRGRLGSRAARTGRRALMRPFQLHHAESVDEALALLEQHGSDETHLMAGGTSVMLLMNLGLIEPAHLISLRRISPLQGIQQRPMADWRLERLTTHRQLELSPRVSAYCPALAATFGHVATVRIRNQGTARRQPGPRRSSPGPTAHADRSGRRGGAHQ